MKYLSVLIFMKLIILLFTFTILIFVCELLSRECILKNICYKLSFPRKLREVPFLPKKCSETSLLALPLAAKLVRLHDSWSYYAPLLLLFLPLLSVHPPQPGAHMINPAAVLMQLAPPPPPASCCQECAQGTSDAEEFLRSSALT